jgi:hypothetical protein
MISSAPAERSGLGRFGLSPAIRSDCEEFLEVCDLEWKHQRRRSLWRRYKLMFDPLCAIRFHLLGAAARFFKQGLVVN